MAKAPSLGGSGLTTSRDFGNLPIQYDSARPARSAPPKGAKTNDRQWHDSYCTRAGEAGQFRAVRWARLRRGAHAIVGALESKDCGRGRIPSTRLRDWEFPASGYWGCPIPIIHCPEWWAMYRCRRKTCRSYCPRTWCPTAPAIRSIAAGLRQYPLSQSAADRPGAKQPTPWTRSSDSSWYFLRYTCAGNDQAMVDQSTIGLDASRPIHRRYRARPSCICSMPGFWTRLNAGRGTDRAFRTVCPPADARAWCWPRPITATMTSGRRHWYNPADVEIERDDKGRIQRATLVSDGKGGHSRRHRENGQVQEQRGRSKGPGRPLRGRHGAFVFDVLAAPPEQSLEWSDAGVEGACGFSSACGPASMPMLPVPARTRTDQVARMRASLRRRLHEDHCQDR